MRYMYNKNFQKWNEIGFIKISQILVYFGSMTEQEFQYTSSIPSGALILAQLVYPPMTCRVVYEPVREKTKYLGSDQVRQKPGCTVQAGKFGFRK